MSEIFPSAVEGKFYDHSYEVVLLGDANTGKSSCLRAFAGEEFNGSYTPTIGARVVERYVNLDETRFRLMIWDTSGQGRFRASNRVYYEGALGYVIVYNTTEQETFDNVPHWINEARTHGETDAAVMVMGGKSDRTDETVVSYETAKEFADKNDVLLFEVSAKDKTNIELALTTFVAKIRQKRISPKDIGVAQN